MVAIKDFKEFKDNIRCCRELKIPKSLYTHHVFVGKKDKKGCDLYHYTVVSSYLEPPGQITKVRLDYKKYDENSSPVQEIFNLQGDNGNIIYIVDRPDYPKDEKAEDECIKRAEQRLGEQSYSACCNNCESYVNWIFSGNNTSEQAENNFKNVLGNMVDGASSRGIQHILLQNPKAAIEFLGKFGEKCISVVGSNVEKMTYLIPTQTVLINSLKHMTNLPNNIKSMLNSNIMKLNVGPKMREELGKLFIPSDVLDVIKQGPTQNVLLELFPSLVEKQHARSFVKQFKTDLIQQLQASSNSAAAGALKINIVSEIVTLLIKMYQIKTDTHMTNDQKKQGCKRELGSFVGGVAGTVIGGTCIPIIGGYIGGFLGNILGGAIGGAL